MSKVNEQLNFVTDTTTKDMSVLLSKSESEIIQQISKTTEIKINDKIEDVFHDIDKKTTITSQK